MASVPRCISASIKCCRASSSNCIAFGSGSGISYSATSAVLGDEQKEEEIFTVSPCLSMPLIVLSDVELRISAISVGLEDLSCGNIVTPSLVVDFADHLQKCVDYA